MKKILLALLSLTVAFSSVCAQDSYETFDGDIIKKGDVIKIGILSSRHAPYIFIREIVNKGGKEEFVNIRENLAYTDLQVREIIHQVNSSYFGSKNTVIRTYSPKLGKEYLVGIDFAISRGEIISRYVDHSKDKAVFLSDDLLLAACIRVNEISIDDRIILLFIKLKDWELYNKCSKDEFEFHAVKDEYRQMLENMANSFDFTATYYIKNSLEIGKYDFAKNAFPLTYIHDTKMNFHKYGDYEFIVTNPSFGKFMPVAPDEARKSNKRRIGMDKHGYVSTLAYGRIYFKLLDKKMELPKEKFKLFDIEKMYRHKIVGVQLTKIEVYDYQHCDYNLIGSVE
ncbi:hypothetical protein M2451_001419 [Dysgonomonas sp. PFB1-18]|uniref:DUF4852 domain-containing protein n=1 Tax=unclassified Dysgonomonas TaxID=2630389 RepID=UPI0024748479|nr:MULTISPECIES: DUF4852 domain-containing protein [unclassified Dysgonomonas]MDH6308853.1 hypothetical protein [Dysgonomonas sp. PF1-14]MDH6338451.1 hypothetical protein [Dysgonomonas sp. PF1-16]MDH6380102.1 hypothetical protein [Dysgonomonas sp. PFB1-18]MDH6397279.1 hypothetical protein [Dysgonomonas sp. PF1-23]